MQMIIPPRPPFFRGRVSDRIKIYGVGIGLLVPAAAHAARSAHLGRRNHRYLRSCDELAFSSLTDPAKAVASIDQDVCVPRGWIGEAIDRRAARRGNLRVDTITLQPHAIISDGPLFIFPVRTVSSRFRLSNCRLHQNIAILRTAARPADMRLAEPVDLPFWLPAGICLIGSHVRAGLDHS